MKFLFSTVLVLFFSFLNAQVGIRTSSPNAQLDVRSSSQTTPTNEDGILVPKVDEFSTVNPTASQDGMLVFVTGLGTPSKGFYYWDNPSTTWISLGGATINAENGINVTAGIARLGGSLTQNTTISQGAWNSNFNLNGTGDFTIQDDGVNKFQVLDNGNIRTGGDVEWRDGNTTGTVLANLSDDGNDGRFLIRENGIVSIDLDANSGAVFNEQGLDRNFRVESDTNANMLTVDAGENRVGIGTATPTKEIHVEGGAKITDGMAIGDIPEYGPHSINIAETGTPSIQMGSMAFNQVEAGRITFTENTPNYSTGPVGAYCGYQWRYDGLQDKLFLFQRCGLESVLLAFERNTREFGVATENPTAALSVNGVANKPGGGDWAVFSDRRLKKDISDYNEGLDLILKVRPVNFTYNSKYAELFGEGDETATTKVFQGVVAQEMQKIAPDMVSVVNTVVDNSNDLDGGSPAPKGGEFLQFDSSKFTYALINSVQQQQKQIEAQQKEIDELKVMVKQLLDKD